MENIMSPVYHTFYMNTKPGIQLEKQTYIKRKFEAELFSPCALLFARYSLVFARCCSARYLLLSTHCFLLFAQCLLAVLSILLFLKITNNSFCPSTFF